MPRVLYQTSSIEFSPVYLAPNNLFHLIAVPAPHLDRPLDKTVQVIGRALSRLGRRRCEHHSQGRWVLPAVGGQLSLLAEL